MDKKSAKELTDKVRTIINEWDFLGVVGGGPLDEYDCLIGPVTRLVSEGKSREEIKAYIEKDLAEHFGIPNQYSKSNLETALDKLDSLKAKHTAQQQRF